MAFHFLQHESVAHGIRRIARSELEEAIADLETTGPGDEQRVHSVRKHTKKLRALLRLVRRSMGADSFRAENACLRDAAAGLAHARRQAVQSRAFEDLVQRYADLIAPRAFEGLRALLASSPSVTNGAGDRGASAELLKGALARVGDWLLAPDDFTLIERGLRDTYAQAREDFRRAEEIPTDENFHEFRKRAKDHWYHVRLLAPCFPGPLEAIATELHRLSELLGDDHDLADLRRTLVADPERIRTEPAGALLALLERRQAELRSEARPLAARLFAEKPKAVARRLRVWFSAWQAEPPSRSRENVHEVHDAADDRGVAEDARVPEASRLD